MSRKMVILTGGQSNPGTAKTAVNLIRYKPEQVVAVLDETYAGKSAQEVLGTGGNIPIVRTLEEAVGANTVAIGIAPAGGRLPANMKSVVLEAIKKRMT